MTVRERILQSRVNYIGPMSERARYHANDHSRDVLTLDPRTVQLEDARSRMQPPCLAREGFALVHHRSAVSDFRNLDEIACVHASETEQLLLELTGADTVVLCGPAVRRFARNAPEWVGLTNSGRLYNTRPVSFVHVDINDSTAVTFARRRQPKDRDRPVRRFAHYNLWRVFSPPPQDVPLALCDSRSVSPSDLVEADAMMDLPGMPASSYVGLLIRYNPCHRWSYFPDMGPAEVLVFKTHDSDAGHPKHVPHSAFNNPASPPTAAPRASIEMRAIAYWFGG